MADGSIHVFWHPDVLLHDSGSGVFEADASPLIDVLEYHPENGVRVQNMKSVLERGPVRDSVIWEDGRAATRRELELMHDPGYIDSICELDQAGGGRVSGTTVVSAGTWKASTAAAGTAIGAAERVASGTIDCALALVRPPGHHAQPAQADGYCFFNNAALAAQNAIDQGLARRVVILDWDVHHGNGTQECFYRRGDVLTISIHMRHGSWGPTHPQTGSPEEIGVGEGAGHNVNIELPAGTGDRGYLDAMEQVVDPVIDQFGPDLLIFAEGQDASQFDPNGRMLVSMAGFHRLGRKARELADRHTDGKLVMVQEGGYARTYAAYCLHATLEGVLGREPELRDPLAFMPEDVDRAAEGIRAVRSALGRFWEL